MRIDDLKQSVVLPFLAPLQTVFYRDRHLYVMVFIIVISFKAVANALGMNVYFKLDMYLPLFSRFLVLTALLYAVGYYLFLLIRLEKRPLKAYFNKAKQLCLNWPEVINFALLALALSTVFSCYTSFKHMIPHLIPYYLDPALVDIEYWLHFGYQPWEFTHAVFSHPYASGIINLMYNLWFFVMWGYLIAIMLMLKQPRAREQAIISFCICWIFIGCLLACLLSSVGPAFYQNMFDNSPEFQPLMQRLEQQQQWLTNNESWLSLWALKMQSILWQNYLHDTSPLGSGISAMPSMHLSVTVLIALTANHVNKIVALFSWLYMLIILIGSVHLAWHYAIDGYASIILTSLIWFGVGKVLDRREQRFKQSREQSN